jgi:crotonobetainyl-CoA:carnitine CoA-transferase CaiB-like acyl-CoA transferase
MPEGLVVALAQGSFRVFPAQSPTSARSSTGDATMSADAATSSVPASPLAGLTVIDCASYIAGPAAATILSDFGARVIKVEPPEGDPFRYLVPGQSYPWDMDSRNKLSLGLDLKQAPGLAVLDRLLSTADVFITNFPLPARARLGIDAARLCATDPG